MVLSFPLFLFLSSPFLLLVCYKRELSCRFVFSEELSLCIIMQTCVLNKEVKLCTCNSCIIVSTVHGICTARGLHGLVFSE